jgi:hypothetical protein
MFARSSFLAAAFSLVVCVGGASAAANPSQDDAADWLGTVKIDSAVLYSDASTSSAQLKSLNKGDTLLIHLEIVAGDDSWCAVSEADDAKTSGYIQGSYLERETPSSFAEWRVAPEPEPVPPDAATGTGPRRLINLSKIEMRRDVEKFFTSKFGRAVPISAYGQTLLHERMGFDHSHAFDVAVSPDSPEGRLLVAYLRSKGIPFIAFRRAVPGIATGAHIHIGRPSPRR